MGKIWQYFLAPGEATEPLPIPHSPWWSARKARIPNEHWRVLLDVSTVLDPNKSTILRKCSEPDSDDDIVELSEKELCTAIEFIQDISRSITSTPEIIVPFQQGLPDCYTYSSYVDMLDSILAVFQESMRMNQPFESWADT